MLSSPYLSLALVFVSLVAGAAFVRWPERTRAAALVFWVSAILALVFFGLWLEETQKPFDLIDAAIIGIAVVVCLLIAIGFYLLSLGRRIGSVEGKIAQHVDARTLGPEQSKAIIDYLLPREKHSVDVLFWPFDEEGSSYASQLYHTLREAGWTANLQHFDQAMQKAKHVESGLKIQAVSNLPEKKAYSLLSQALNNAEVQVNGSGWTNANGGPESLYLSVGPRPYTIAKRGGGGWGG